MRKVKVIQDRKKSERAIESHRKKRAKAKAAGLVQLVYTKKCSVCGEVKTVDLREPGAGDFPVEKRRRGDGSIAKYAKSQCRDCARERVIRWREEQGREELRRRQKQWDEAYDRKHKGKGKSRSRAAERRAKRKKEKELAMAGSGAMELKRLDMLDGRVLVEWARSNKRSLGGRNSSAAVTMADLSQAYDEERWADCVLTQQKADTVCAAFGRPDLMHTLWD